MKMKFFLMTVLLAGVIGTASFSSAKTNGSATSAEKWYGGKPRPPMDVQFLAPGPLQPNMPSLVSATLIPTSDCDQLTVQLRGLHGVTILSGGLEAGQTCQSGVPIQLSATVVAASGISGTLVADISFTTENGTYSLSSGIAISSVNALPKQKLSLGNLKRDDQGNLFVVIKADETVQ